MTFGTDRKLAQAMLEGYILLGSIAGWMAWEDENKWFWKDENNQFIILKEWI